MQPRYITYTSTSQTTWYLPNWHQTTPQDISFAVISTSTGTGQWNINVAYEDPGGTYPSPNSSSPTPFPLVTGGSANAVIAVPSSMKPIAAYQLVLTTASTGGKTFLVVNQTGIG